MNEVVVENIDPEWIDVGDGIRIAKSWDAVVTGEPDIPGTIRVHVVYDQQLRRAAAASVRLDRPGEGEEVTTTSLRDVRVQEVVVRSAISVTEIARPGGVPEAFGQYLITVREEADRDYTQTVLEAVRLYRLAATVNLAPLKLISTQLEVSVSTATRMMSRAREAGYAEDLITRETYNRMRADEDRAAAPQVSPIQGPSGPSIGL